MMKKEDAEVEAVKERAQGLSNKTWLTPPQKSYFFPLVSSLSFSL